MTQVEGIFKNLEDEAYARIIWGDSPKDVCDWLVTGKGLSSGQAETLVAKFLSDRRAEIRRSGIRVIWVSLGFIAVCALFLVLTSASRVYYYKISMLFLTGLVFGIYRLFVGFWRLVSGNAAGAISDLE